VRLGVEFVEEFEERRRHLGAHGNKPRAVAVGEVGVGAMVRISSQSLHTPKPGRARSCRAGGPRTVGELGQPGFPIMADGSVGVRAIDVQQINGGVGEALTASSKVERSRVEKAPKGASCRALSSVRISGP